MAFEKFQTNRLDHKRTLLIIEDNEINRDFLCNLVAPYYNCITAENGKVGFDILRRNYKHISCVLLDIQMPIMNGYDFLERVAIDPALQSIPIIVTTGNKNDEEEERCLKLGASDFVAKPYNTSVVLHRIAGLIKLKESSFAVKNIEIDEVSTIYTRQAFLHNAQEMILRYPDVKLCLVMCDILNLRNINEYYGRKVGDYLIKQISMRLKHYKCDYKVYGRYQDGQFAMLFSIPQHLNLSDMPFGPEFNFLVDEEGIQHPIKYGAYEGIANGMTIQEACDKALQALASIKYKSHLFASVYDDSLKQSLDKAASLEMAFEESLDEGYFKPYFQPKHDAVTGELVGAEALVRLDHPKMGLIMPNDFVPLFEKNGFIPKLDYYIWKRTASCLKKWMDKGLKVFPISVNASKVDFFEKNFFEKMSGIPGRYDIPPHLLHIEITESIFDNRPDELCEILNNCHNLGFKLELDDFGTGYSSLHSLLTLPLDTVKLDRSFILRSNSPRGRQVLAMCFELAKKLGFTTVSEGVETKEQVDMIKEFGGDYVQGYYYSKPLPEDEFEQYIKDHS